MINSGLNQTIGFNYGWICPKCGNVYSPQTTECYNCNKTENKYTSTTITFNGGEENGTRREIEENN